MGLPKGLDVHLDRVKDLYYAKGLSATRISKQFNVSHTAILDLLERHNYPRRTRSQLGEKQRIYVTNHGYFKAIDTSEKAYWLGFLYADGYNEVERNIIAFKLQEKDGEMVEKFNKAIGSNRIVATHPNGDKQASKCIRIASPEMSKDLANLGMIQAKSLILDFPSEYQVPQRLIHHFVRGYFDGDGCITWRGNRVVNAQLSLCVTEKFGLKLKEVVFQATGLSLYFLQKNKIYHQGIGGRLNCLQFYRWMYQDAGDLFLPRKRAKFEILNQYSIKRLNSSSRFHGVCFIQQIQKYQVFVRYRKLKKYLGAFVNEIDAARAYNDYLIANNIPKDLNNLVPDLSETLHHEG